MKRICFFKAKSNRLLK